MAPAPSIAAGTNTLQTLSLAMRNVTLVNRIPDCAKQLQSQPRPYGDMNSTRVRVSGWGGDGLDNGRRLHHIVATVR
jgi:hypothetical protein